MEVEWTPMAECWPGWSWLPPWPLLPLNLVYSPAAAAASAWPEPALLLGLPLVVVWFFEPPLKEAGIVCIWLSSAWLETLELDLCWCAEAPPWLTLGASGLGFFDAEW